MTRDDLNLPRAAAVATAPQLPERTIANDADLLAAAAESQPFVMRQLVPQWPALLAGTAGAQDLAEYLLRFDGGAPLELLVGPPSINGRFFYRERLEGFNFERTTIPLPLLLEQLLRLAASAEPPAIYAGAAVAADAFPGWTEANPLPLSTPGAVPRLWLGNGTRASAHYDGSSNIAVVVAGRRRFALFPPEQGRNLYVGPLDFTLAGQPVSLCDIEAPDLDRYPRFAAALETMQVAILEPGDAIFIPAMWWHDVRAAGPLNLLANYWYGHPASASPFAALVHAIFAIRDLPVHERNAVRGWFDQYVFAGTANLEHLPTSMLGVLGPSSAIRDDAIRQYLRRVIDQTSA